jgi:hypothetical protein
MSGANLDAAGLISESSKAYSIRQTLDFSAETERCYNLVSGFKNRCEKLCGKNRQASSFAQEGDQLK